MSEGNSHNVTKIPCSSPSDQGITWCALRREKSLIKSTDIFICPIIGSATMTPFRYEFSSEPLPIRLWA